MFDVEISKIPYMVKPDEGIIRDMRFEKLRVDINAFAQYIEKGYSYCNVMRNDYRDRDNFDKAWFITYDIDGCGIDLIDCVNELNIKPAIGYVTPSNGLDGYRYRLVYVLDEPICSFPEFYNYSNSLCKTLKLNEIVGFDNKGKSCVDGRSFLPEQYWNGCYQCSTIIVNNDNILSLSNISYSDEFYNKKYTHSTNTNKVSSNTLSISSHNGLSDTFFNEAVLDDFYRMRNKDFVDKYRDIYPNMEHTEIEYGDDEPIIYYPDDYFEIRRPYERINGEVVKIKDGEGRRRRLFLNGIIRRKINPNISPDNMLFNIVYEFEYYYLNNGNVIDKATILSIVRNIMNADVLDNDFGKPKNKFFVNEKYCQKYGMTKKQVMGKVNNKKQYIGEYYDLNMTDEENIRVMKEYGLVISKPTLNRWKKENGIRKNKKKDIG